MSELGPGSGEPAANGPGVETVPLAPPAPPLSPRALARKLKRARAECRDFLKEVRRLRRRYAARLDPKHVEELDFACIGLEQAMAGDDLHRLGGALETLDGLVERHLGFARRSPALEYTVSISKALAIALVLRLFVVEAFKIPSGSMIPTLLIGDHIFVNKLSYGVRLPVVNWELAHWGGYRRGDVVVFVNPQDDDRPLLDRRDYIKRVAGLPGDLIEVKDEVLTVNGEPQPRVLTQEKFQYWDRQGDGGAWYPIDAQLWTETLRGPDGQITVRHPVLRDPERHPRGAYPSADPERPASYEGPFRVPEGHLFMMGDNRDNSQDGRAGGWYVPFGHVKGRAMIVWLSWGKPGFGIGEGAGLRLERFFKPVR